MSGTVFSGAERARLDAAPRHPRRLYGLAVSQMSERFAFFGVQALLFLYVDQYLLGGMAEQQVWGFEELKDVLRATLHVSRRSEIASVLFGLFTGLGFLATIVAGALADRWLGVHRVIVLSGGLALAGYVLLTMESCFLIGMLLVSVGAGAFKANMTTQISQLYSGADPRREWGFRVFFIGVNLGMLVAPVVCGALGEARGYRYSFAASGAGMALAIMLYTLPWRGGPRPARLVLPAGRYGWTWRKASAFAIFFAVLSVTLVGVQQIYNAYVGWADAHVRLDWHGRSIPTTVLLSIDTGFTVIMMSVSAWLWRGWGRFFPQPAAWAKIGMGCLLLAVAYGCLSAIRGDADPALGVWLLAFHAINSLAFANISPVALAFLSRCAPEGAKSTFLSIFYLEFAVGSFLAGGIGRWLDSIPAPVFWGAHAAMFALAGCAMLLSGRWISAILVPSEVAPLAPAAAHRPKLAA